jgi:putative transposase
MYDKQKNEHIIRRNHRLYITEGLYFITSITANRNPTFQDQEAVELLKNTLHNVKQLYPFAMQAYVFLPDHFHLLIKPNQSITISQIIHSFKRNFTFNYKKTKNIPNSDSITLWQYGSWDHVIRDENDYNKHLDYIHYNPVKHGYVTKPEDFSHTSYMTYIEKGWYEIGWGHKEPENLRDMDFE